MTVAALYVEKNGVYYGLPDVDPWDEERDARWAKLGRVATRYQDGGCFEAALRSVREFGGVLEHPAESRAWPRYGLRRPAGAGWTTTLDGDGWVCLVDQWHYGYPTRKPTWLYYVGADPPALPYRVVKSDRGCDSLWSTKRSKTPLAFRDVLLDMARSASTVPA